MDDTLLNGFNNGRDASDGVGGRPPMNIKYIDKSKQLQSRHEEIKREMLKVIDAINLLQEQYNSLEIELYAIEEQYVDNLKNIVE